MLVCVAGGKRSRSLPSPTASQYNDDMAQIRQVGTERPVEMQELSKQDAAWVEKRLVDYKTLLDFLHDH